MTSEILPPVVPAGLGDLPVETTGGSFAPPLADPDWFFTDSVSRVMVDDDDEPPTWGLV